MSPLEDLQSRATALLTRTESTATVEAKIASTEGPSRRFSPFIPSELDRAIALAGELMKIAEEQDVAAALEEAERRARRRGRPARPPRRRDVHRPRPRGRAAGDPADPAAAPEARGRAARRGDRARVGARLVPRGPARQRPPPPLAHRLPGARPPGPRRPRSSRTARASCSSTCTSRCSPATTPSGARSASARSSRSPTTASRSARATRTGPSGQALRDVDRQDTGPLLVSELEEQRDRLLAAVTAGAAQNGGGPRPLTSELLGALEEPTAGTLWGDVWHHGYGHVITAFVMAPHGGGDPGDIGDTSTAIRDPFFWRWHRHVDDANFALQERAEPFAFDDAPEVTLTGVELASRPTPARRSTSSRRGGDDRRRRARRPRAVPVAPAAENPGAEERTVTVRIFLAPAEAAEDRRAWIEMDKFEHVAGAGRERDRAPGPPRLPGRKPAERPPVLVQGPAQTPHEQYCRCGWPYHLLVPRGTPAGMPFRVLVMLTDWELTGSRRRRLRLDVVLRRARPLPRPPRDGLPVLAAAAGRRRRDARGAAHRPRARPHDPARPAAAGLTMGEHDDLLRRSRRACATTRTSSTSPTARPSGPTTRATSCGDGGKLIARAPELTLGFLGPETYPDGAKVERGDYIGDPKRDYRGQYVKLRIARPELKNRVYGRAVEDDGRLWLQYWLWYFYNDYSLALGAGLHEGDWEMVQLRMHGDEPDLAVYAQHTHAEKRAVARGRDADGGHHPLVYVARGSHASYFEAGFHTTEAWYDLADGKRNSPELALEILEGDGPGWARWPGRWGDTQPRCPAACTSRARPARARRGSGADPAALLDTARIPERREAPRRPRSRSRARATGCGSTSTSSATTPPPRSLVVTVNSRDEARRPPRTYTFTLEDTAAARSTRASRPTPPSTTTSTRAPPPATRRCRRSRR